MQIKDLQDGIKKVTIEAQVGEKQTERSIKSRFKDETYRVCDAIIIDDTGSIKLTLWNEQIDLVQVGDRVRIENGYVTRARREHEYIDNG